MAPAASNGAQRPATSWNTAPRIKATVSKQPQFSEAFTIPVGDLSTAGKDGKPTSLGEVMKRTMNQYKVKIEASTNNKSRQTTFHLRSENKKDFEKAKKTLLAGLSPVVRVRHEITQGYAKYHVSGFLGFERTGFYDSEHYWAQGC